MPLGGGEEKHSILISILRLFFTSITFKKDNLFSCFTHIHAKTVTQKWAVINNKGQSELWSQGWWPSVPKARPSSEHVPMFTTCLLLSSGPQGATDFVLMTHMTSWSHSSTQTSCNHVHSKSMLTTLALASWVLALLSFVSLILKLPHTSHSFHISQSSMLPSFWRIFSH